MGAAVCATKGVWTGAKTWVPTNVVPEDDVIGTVPRVMCTIEPRAKSSLWPVRIQVVTGKTYLATLDKCVLVATV